MTVVRCSPSRPLTLSGTVYANDKLLQTDVRARVKRPHLAVEVQDRVAHRGQSPVRVGFDQQLVVAVLADPVGAVRVLHVRTGLAPHLEPDRQIAHDLEGIVDRPHVRGESQAKVEGVVRIGVYPGFRIPAVDVPTPQVADGFTLEPTAQLPGVPPVAELPEPGFKVLRVHRDRIVHGGVAEVVEAIEVPLVGEVHVPAE